MSLSDHKGIFNGSPKTEDMATEVVMSSNASDKVVAERKAEEKNSGDSDRLEVIAVEDHVLEDGEKDIIFQEVMNESDEMYIGELACLSTLAKRKRKSRGGGSGF